MLRYPKIVGEQTWVRLKDINKNVRSLRYQEREKQLPWNPLIEFLSNIHEDFYRAPSSFPA